MKIYIENKGLKISNMTIANTFISRLKGWIGKKMLDDNEAIMLIPCSSIHTFGMKMTIDVMFLDKSNRIVYLIKEMNPNRISPIIPQAKKVIEMKSGLLNAYLIEMHDQVVIFDD
ncbi:hypothetical protein BHF71_10055 [Vulcanibacillus modesticaldus]|uniref:DUF192 domain-containing protein n=1 Tax=Vulcanibacillus modesticaldus TaxID=337097 RepID=A0A1D2YTX3_9BACI|nr:DUF192 domain-containing protein [Vulcanibacillus modesticaldus]OEF99137.1 hypothetical protein BHF71_10055 [Vulcanibacillus modesticaldus]